MISVINTKLFYIQRRLKYINFKNCLRCFTSAKRTNDSNPQNHSFNDIGSFYTIPDNDFTTCFELQIKNDFSRLLKLFNDKSIIIRNPAVEVINYLKNSDYTQPINRYIFYGKIGSGKSVQMAHVSHYAFTQSNWLLIHFSNIFDFLNMSTDLNPNSRDEKILDTPTLSGFWLKSFLNMNHYFLKKYNPKTLKEIQWNQKESMPVGSLWIDMINFAISRPKYATDCIGIILREAREHAQLNEFKVLGILRGVNCLFQLSRKADTAAQYIPAERIGVLCYLKRFMKNDWCNGAIICSVNQDTIYRITGEESYYPKCLLGNGGMQDLNPFVPIYVESYTDQETLNYLNFLAENHWLTIPEAIDPHGIGRREIVFLADNRPLELFNITREW